VDISQEDAKVCYDDMHDFGQSLHDVWLANVAHQLILYKTNMASAFLNWPTHPIWQIHQTIVVEGKLYIVC
jgi:hypothetical protein